MAFSPIMAKQRGIKVRFLSYLFIALSGVSIALTSKIAGALIVSSLIIIPLASAMQVTGSYKNTINFAIIFSMLAFISGLVLSFYLDLKPGATIVLVSIFIFLLCLLLKDQEKKPAIS
jgi:zinc transport system permease protein